MKHNTKKIKLFILAIMAIHTSAMSMTMGGLSNQQEKEDNKEQSEIEKKEEIAEKVPYIYSCNRWTPGSIDFNTVEKYDTGTESKDIKEMLLKHVGYYAQCLFRENQKYKHPKFQSAMKTKCATKATTNSPLLNALCTASDANITYTGRNERPILSVKDNNNPTEQEDASVLTPAEESQKTEIIQSVPSTDSCTRVDAMRPNFNVIERYDRPNTPEELKQTLERQVSQTEDCLLRTESGYIQTGFQEALHDRCDRKSTTSSPLLQHLCKEADSNISLSELPFYPEDSNDYKTPTNDSLSSIPGITPEKQNELSSSSINRDVETTVVEFIDFDKGNIWGAPLEMFRYPSKPIVKGEGYNVDETVPGIIQIKMDKDMPDLFTMKVKAVSFFPENGKTLTFKIGDNVYPITEDMFTKTSSFTCELRIPVNLAGKKEKMIEVSLPEKEKHSISLLFKEIVFQKTSAS